MSSKQSSKHLDNKEKATRAAGESKKTNLMDGIVTGLPKKVSPVIVDGICRGIARGPCGSVQANLSKVVGSATPNAKGAFGSGAFPEGKM
jgi:hypothetical protein